MTVYSKNDLIELLNKVLANKDCVGVCGTCGEVLDVEFCWCEHFRKS